MYLIKGSTAAIMETQTERSMEHEIEAGVVHLYTSENHEYSLLSMQIMLTEWFLSKFFDRVVYTTMYSNRQGHPKP